jgi:hypothetical protein
MLPKLLTLVRVAERTETPGAEIFGFSKFGGNVPGPRLLKLAKVLVLSIAPTENEAA